MKAISRADISEVKPAVAEIYRMLQMRMNSEINAGNMKVISFTSVDNCKSKSPYVCNIAKSMVLEGKKVLLIDCNIERPIINHYLGVKTEMLYAEEKIHNSDYRYICKVKDISGLDFIPGGTRLKDSTGKLDISKITEIIDKNEADYDIILLDSPPAGIVTEGVKLSMISDGTVLVMASGKTPRTSAKRVREMLDAVNATVLGVILEQ